MTLTSMVPSSLFQSTLSVRRATAPIAIGGDVKSFQSTLSVRRATGGAIESIEIQGISIHALRKESDKKFLTAPYAYIISIHALRKESDPLTNGKGAHNGKISIHALRKESDNAQAK